eukprot:1158432-Pelagomonas_calceolata.AAC.4
MQRVTCCAYTMRKQEVESTESPRIVRASYVDASLHHYIPSLPHPTHGESSPWQAFLRSGNSMPCIPRLAQTFWCGCAQTAAVTS